MTDDADVAHNVAELVPSKFMFSKKETKKWDFFNKTTNKQTTGSNDWVEVYYDQVGRKLAFVIENVKCNTGIQTTDNFKRGYMSVTLNEDQSKMIREKVDDPIFQLAWEHRKDLFKSGRKMEQPIEMKHSYRGVRQDGKEKKDKDKNPVRGPNGDIQCWSDSVTADIAMKKKDQQPVVDENSCQIIDLNNQRYAWTSLGGKMLREVVCEVDKVVFSDKIAVHCSFRLIVPDEVGSGGARYTTKRRLEAVPAPASAAATDGKGTAAVVTATDKPVSASIPAKAVPGGDAPAGDGSAAKKQRVGN